MRAWMLALRLRTLPAALAPVCVGAAVAASVGGFRLGPAVAAAAGALLLQVGANLANDLFDHERGADGPDRLGPPRASAQGWITPREMRVGIGVVLGSAALVGASLAAVGGWPVVAIGVLSIAAALAYTGGPFPFGYHGLGDAAVFLFFGPIAVGGTVWVQALALPPEALLASLPVGALATAILVVNNLRDVETDRAAGKRTLAVRLGARAARLEYGALVLGSYAALPLFAYAYGAALLLPLGTLPWAVRLVRRIAGGEAGPSLNGVLAATAKLELGYCVAFAAGWLP